MFIIFIYLNIIRYTKWAINTRNLVLIQYVQYNGPKDLRNLWMCGIHFKDSLMEKGNLFYMYASN